MRSLSAIGAVYNEIAFQDRAALVADRSAGQSGAYAKIMGYYALRNQIAHGRLQVTRIDIPAVVQDSYVIQSQLRT
jgi:membrane associated rhomboid family serine protease